MMDRNIGLEAVRLTEAAAMASARLMGRGDEKAADQAAVDAMRKAFNALNIRGTIVIGEGERDEAPPTIPRWTSRSTRSRAPPSRRPAGRTR
jgi:fructose-1,6-bisphosphatase/sedoheptulose 1,7-bisphosphatase-like protein